MLCLEDIGTISTLPQVNNIISFQWEVPNYFACKYEPQTVQAIPHTVSSPCFSAFSCKWRLALVRSTDEGLVTSRFIGIFLWRMSSCMNEAPGVSVRISLCHNNDRIYKSFGSSGDLNGNFGSWNFLPVTTFTSSKNVISPSGVLKFHCIVQVTTPTVPVLPIPCEENKKKEEIVVVKDVVQEKIPEEKGEENKKNDENAVAKDLVDEEMPEAKGVDLLSDSLKRILIEEQNCDVVLKVGDREFKAHRTILMARSPVFASMFKHDTKENSTGEVDIPDCSAAAFEVFLLYLYTGSVDKMSSDNVCELYYAGDKYQMNDLKSECVKYMKDNLSVKKFCAIMTLSLQHRESDLQEKATDFFCGNVKEIIKTVEWQEYLRDCPTEANELFIKVINA